jgi:hypothetical protein
MPVMTHEQVIYIELLKAFSSTLQETSKDDSGVSKNPPEPVVFMTDCQAPVVSFDSFKNNIVQNGWGGIPKSCDALYMCDADMWFLIEFKNGQIENANKKDLKTNEIYDAVRKLFESLFLLTEKLGQTIEFTRRNLVFILVYNEDKNKGLGGEYLAVKSGITKWGHHKGTLQMCPLSEIVPAEPFNIAYFDKLYVKDMYICSKKTFNEEFVKKRIK